MKVSILYTSYHYSKLSPFFFVAEWTDGSIVARLCQYLVDVSEASRMTESSIAAAALGFLLRRREETLLPFHSLPRHRLMLEFFPSSSGIVGVGVGVASAF